MAISFFRQAIWSAAALWLVSAGASAADAGHAPAPRVGVVEVQEQAVTLTKNLPGRLEASRTAVVQARVTGIVKQRLFQEGAYVETGTVLFHIDDESFRASLASANAQLAQAKATEKLNLADIKRYQDLLKRNMLSRQVYDQAQATLAVTRANIKMAQAAITQAKLNLSYAHVTAPISGFIGQANVTEGALVSASVGTQMAQIQQIDPLYVNIRQPASEVLKLKRMLMAQKETRRDMAVKVALDDGTPYGEAGKLLFTDVNVNAGTGEASLRATLPNPDNFLMPGLYVRADVPQIRLPKAFLVPQQAITRGRQDTLLVVNADNSFAPRVVKVLQSQGNNWVVTEGLSTGDKIIVDGVMHLRGVKKVTPVPWQSAGVGSAADAKPAM